MTTRHARVLIAEDDPHLRGLLTLLLRRAGDIDFEAVGDGKAALEMLAEQRFDVVILDLMMPILSGYDVIDALARMEKPRPAVLVVSAQLNPTRLNSDVVSFVVRKPFDVELLSAIIDDAVRRLVQDVDEDQSAEIIPFSLPQ